MKNNINENSKKIIVIFTMVMCFFKVNIYFSQVFLCDGQSQQVSSYTINEIKESGKWHLVFEDNFDQSQLDNNKWFTSVDGWSRVLDSTKELQYYKSENCVIEDGKLKLIAKEEPGMYDVWEFDSVGTGYIVQKPFNYTSGWAETKMDFEYGYFEISAKVPKGKSFWPAFWFYGCPYELDVFEFDGNNTSEINTNLFNWFDCDTIPNINCPKGIEVDNIDFSEGYHKYAVEWNQYKVTFFIDGIQRREVYKYYGTDNQPLQSESGNNYSQNYFRNIVFPDKPMSLRLNFAIGDYDAGYGDGPPNSTTIFPSSLYIEYVRIWKKDNDNLTTTLCDLFPEQLEPDDPNHQTPSILTGKEIEVGGTNCISNILSEEDLNLLATEEIVLKPNFNSFVGSRFCATILTGGFKNNLSEINEKQTDLNLTKNDFDFEVYPNPFKTYFQVKSVNTTNITSIKVSDLNGIIIFEIIKPLEEEIIDLSDVTNGVYFIEVKNSTQSKVKKIIHLENDK